MSPSPLESGHDDAQLVRYLLGLLPEGEAERLDELSIADDAVALRLRVLEDDLVDAYVRGDLEGDTLRRFESFYLASARRREKVRFARAFRGAVDRAAGRPDPDSEPAPAGEPGAVRTRVPARGRWTLLWSLAAAGLLVLMGGALIVEEIRLRDSLHAARTQNDALELRLQALSQQMSADRAAVADAIKALEQARPTPSAPAPRAPAETPDRTSPSGQPLVLQPQTRAISAIPALVIPAGVSRATLELRLESNDHRQYQAALSDPATNRIIWRSGWVAAEQSAGTPSVVVSVPASLLKPQHYSLELSGRNAAGAAELVATYAFQRIP